jgi:hypothetical protein
MRQGFTIPGGQKRNRKISKYLVFLMLHTMMMQITMGC